MKKQNVLGTALAGSIAGIVNGLFGAGGGMVLVPLLTILSGMKDEEIFPASISIILPICLVSLTVTSITGSIPFRASVPYLIGSAAGGFLAGVYGKKIPVTWLHRGLGILILWGGWQYIC